MFSFEENIYLARLLEWICVDPVYISRFEKPSGTVVYKMFIQKLESI